MLTHSPALVELHCTVADLAWQPAREYHVPLAIHVPEYSPDGELLDPASANEPQRKRAEMVYVDAVRAALRWAPFFPGTPLIVAHPGGATPADPDDDAGHNEERYKALGRTVAAMTAVANSHVKVLVENLPRSCWFYGGSWKANIVLTGQDLARCARKYGVGVVLDLCHLYQACNELHLDFMAEIAAAAPHVEHVHYSDSRGVAGEGLQVGEGDMPLARVFNSLSGQLGDKTVFAVPEIWFGHEHGGLAFARAWGRMDELLSFPVDRGGAREATA